MIKVTFLGTSDAVPSKDRNHTAILLKYNSEEILVDCGEGTQRQFRKAGLNPMGLTRILISHWHGDHILGIPGLLQTLVLNGYDKTLFIYGPKGTKKFMGELLKTFVFVNKLDIKVEEVEGKFLETKEFYIEARKLYHSTYCNAYNFVEKDRLRINKEKLLKHKILEGPHLQKLKEGKDLVYEGKKYKAKDLTYTEKGRKISVVLDTNFNKNIFSIVKDADLLICESSFGSELTERAKEYNHLTSEQAAMFAKKGNVKTLFLTHISQRYEKHLDLILKEAKKIFKNSFIAKDLESVDV
jgi:ribonuclease Z